MLEDAAGAILKKMAFPLVKKGGKFTWIGYLRRRSSRKGPELPKFGREVFPYLPEFFPQKMESGSPCDELMLLELSD